MAKIKISGKYRAQLVRRISRQEKYRRPSLKLRIRELKKASRRPDWTPVAAPRCPSKPRYRSKKAARFYGRKNSEGELNRWSTPRVYSFSSRCEV